MLKSKLLKIFSQILSSSNRKVEKELEKSDVISFDIFDTLVKRDVDKPSDIFCIMGKQYLSSENKKLKNFKEIRVRSEQIARKGNKEEIIINDIYEAMEISDKSKNYLISVENRIEYLEAIPNLSMKCIYEKMREHKKTIVITSDMYLQEKFINKILDKCGYYGYEKLYLSSTYNKTKATGALFDVLLDDYPNKKIIHIGDNVKRDYFRPRTRGIKSMLIYGNKINTKFWPKSPRLNIADKSIYEQYKSFINNREPIGISNAQRIGYEVLGPLLLGFCQYLHEELHKNKVEKIFFLSRDGKIIQNAYHILFPHDHIEKKYLYVSRHALIVPLLESAHSYDDILSLLAPFFHLPILETIAECCLFKKEEFARKLSKLGYTLSTKINAVKENDKEKIYNLVMELADGFFSEQRELLLEYLNSNKFYGNIAVVDIGWNGTIQRALLQYVDANTVISGYYLGIRDNYYSDIIRYGYLFDATRNAEYNYMTRFTAEIFDILFIGTDGTVKAYQKKHEIVEPVLDISEYGDYEKQFITEIHNSAITFIRSIFEHEIINKYRITPDMIMCVFKKFAVYPTLETLRPFEKIYLSDGSIIKKLLPQYSLFYYFFHPNYFKRELNMNICKIWYFKWLFKIPFPYYKLLRLSVKIGMKSDLQKIVSSKIHKNKSI